MTTEQGGYQANGQAGATPGARQSGQLGGQTTGSMQGSGGTSDQDSDTANDRGGMAQSGTSGQGGSGAQGDSAQNGMAGQSTGQGASGEIASQIHEHMDVLSNSGERIGRVDSIEGDLIKLTRTDSEDGQHHYVACSDVAAIKDDQVHLSSSARAMPSSTARRASS